MEKEFGFQSWWPRFEEGKFVYNENNKDKPLSSKQRFIICISAILTQNTNWKNVEKAIKNLDKFNFLNKEAIKQINEEELGELIKSSGYYKQKAKKLKKFVEFDGEINRENLLEIWGIGKETADSILLYAFSKPFFVIDAYTKRIFEKLGYKSNSYDGWQKLFMNGLPKNVKLFKEYHALIVELGKNYCKKKN